MTASRLERQIAFIIELDKMKNIFRKTKVLGTDRHENDAEHTWHLALMAIVLAEHANVPELDLTRVVKMLLIHDVVEIDAGDTFAYDVKGHEDKAEREQMAADRLFGMLPEEQRDELMALWHEFEANETPEARFALALDRLHPMLLNFHNNGQSWRENGITHDRVLARNSVIENGSEALWAYAKRMVEEALAKGILS
ncbi:HD family hydrolase [Paenibacillus chartarius]|uniref:HD family hydrolase n=1 Tax=Paenibacillus chartarius TaxID=747481 RepID=A0ABV6DSM5_9BACL